MFKKRPKFDSKPCKIVFGTQKCKKNPAARAKKKQKSKKTLIFDSDTENFPKMAHFLYTGFKRIKKH